MSDQAAFSLRGRNPDVLTCIANLSNDEVFTPPEFAGRILDDLTEAWATTNDGADLWADPTVTFLDPVTKTGVFLREVASRLTKGLEATIPNLEDRVDHVLTKQVFGIGITHLTSLMARRSLYCSKDATGPYSIARSLTGSDGNIWFKREEHTWVGGRCRFCGATQRANQRAEDLETHAYTFIHTNDIQARVAELFGSSMHFDVIVGNPPYQLKDGGHSASAVPIYHKFIEQAMALEPRYLAMVTPSRWFVGGRGLDAFRAGRLADRRTRLIVDFIVDKDAFPKLNINGGVNYFLWDRDYVGDCTITTVEPGGAPSEPATRSLSEFDVFVRRNTAVSILRKVRAEAESTFDESVGPLKPFGLRTNFFGDAAPSDARPIKLHSSGKVTWVAKSQITANATWVDAWKVLVAAATDGNENYPLPIWDRTGPFVAGPGEACSETYLVAARAATEEEALRIRDYMRTKFFRFLVSLRKAAQHNKSDNFGFVPALATDVAWTDEALFARYGLNEEEVAFIHSMVRTVEWASA